MKAGSCSPWSSFGEMEGVRKRDTALCNPPPVAIVLSSFDVALLGADVGAREYG